MNDPENFLNRWSRRKRIATDEAAPATGEGEREHDVAQKPRAEHAAIDGAPPTPLVDAVPAQPAFDLAKLPSIESITAETDIRAFLAPGVPAEMRLAALRRAWAADPKVRDFVGLNDYDFDFHTPGAIPGFGPLEMTDELRREVLQIVGALQPEPEAKAAPTPVAVVAEMSEPMEAQPPEKAEEINVALRPGLPAAIEQPAAGPDRPVSVQAEVIAPQATMQRSEDYIASQQEHPLAENLHTSARRGHGRALPK